MAYTYLARPEIKQKFIDAHKKPRKTTKGYKMSEKSRQNISKGRKGIKPTPEALEAMKEGRRRFRESDRYNAYCKKQSDNATLKWIERKKLVDKSVL